MTAGPVSVLFTSTTKSRPRRRLAQHVEPAPIEFHHGAEVRQSARSRRGENTSSGKRTQTARVLNRKARAGGLAVFRTQRSVFRPRVAVRRSQRHAVCAFGLNQALIGFAVHARCRAVHEAAIVQAIALALLHRFADMRGGIERERVAERLFVRRATCVLDTSPTAEIECARMWRGVRWLGDGLIFEIERGVRLLPSAAQSAFRPTPSRPTRCTKGAGDAARNRCAGRAFASVAPTRRATRTKA